VAPPKKSGLSKRVISHQQINKLKHKGINKGRLSVGRKKGQSPSVRGGRGGTAASEDADSVLSSADASETDASQSRGRRANKKQAPDTADVEMGEDEEMEDDEGEDDKRYCFCDQRSYGEMVACENDDCPYQWFHTGCLNMKKVPDEDEDWYCPTCREKPEIIEKVRLKKKAGRK
jgi:inhibitor of growth protein 3